MSAFVVLNIQELSRENPRILHEIEKIYFETSPIQYFENDKAKEEFRWKYFGYYLHHYPDLIWVALDEEKKSLGYILGATKSNNPELLSIQPHMKLFEGELDQFPGHLHINCRADQRSKGIGGVLLQSFDKGMKDRGVKGVHAVTTVGSLNRNFYIRHGLTHEVVANYNSSKLLFMAKECY